MKQDSSDNVLAEIEIERPRRAARGSPSPIVDALRIAAPLAIVLVGVGAFAGLLSFKEPPAKQDETIAPPLVETALVTPHSGGLDFSVDGVVVPYRDIRLSNEVAGRISSKPDVCRAGNYVTKGTLLFEIDSRDYEIEVDRIQREWAQADVSLKELDVEVENTTALIELAKEQLSLHRKEVERLQPLNPDRFISDTEMDRVKREELTALNTVTTLNNQLNLLGTRRARLESARDHCQSLLDKAQLELTRTKIVAPIDGVIAEEMVEEDSYVQKGTTLIRMVDTSAAEVRCNLQMDDLYWLWSQAAPDRAASTEAGVDYEIPRTPVTIVYDMGGRRFLWDGELSRFEGVGVDQQTRTVPCRAVAPDPRKVRVEDALGKPLSGVGPPALVQGMYVNVIVHASPDERLLVIPESALRPGNKVWQLVDGQLSIKPVRVARTDRDSVLVYAEGSGLEPGMRLVSSPLAVAEEGMDVREEHAPVEPPAS